MRKLLIAIAVAGLVGVGLWMVLAGCGKKPTEPVAGGQVDYPVYFLDREDGEWYYEYHPMTDSLDSVYLPIVSGGGIYVSADGKILYVGHDDVISLYDLETKTIVGELPYAGKIIVSPDNETVAIVGEDLHFLSTADYSVLFQDTTDTRDGSFTSDGRRFYCIRTDSGYADRYVCRVDLENGFAISRINIPRGPLREVIPSFDEQLLFLYYMYNSCISGFAVYDIPADSVIFSELLVPGHGSLTAIDNGRSVLYTNPGDWISLGCPMQPSEFYQYFPESNSITTISTKNIIPLPEGSFYPVGRFVLTPDDRYLVGIDYGFEYILTLDASTFEVVQYYETRFPSYMRFMNCQKLE